MSVAMPVISAGYLALAGVFNLGLIWRVVEQRRASRIGLGDQGNAALLQRVRVHANAMENLPLQLLMLLAFELLGAPAAWVHAAGVCILLGRVLHAYGLSTRTGVSFGRFYGTLLSMLSTLGLAIGLLLRASGIW